MVQASELGRWERLNELAIGTGDGDRIRSWAKSKAHGGSHPSPRRFDSGLLPISSPQTSSSAQSHPASTIDGTSIANSNSNNATLAPSLASNGVAGSTGEKTDVSATAGGDTPGPPATAPAKAEEQGPHVADGEAADTPPKKPLLTRFVLNFKAIMLARTLNVLLIFVPVGIVVEFIPNMPPGVIFAMNAIAIVPLAGLLSFATEMVASKLGDSLGALLNVTFGNAVELIIFIALVKNEIRIVQASTLGSILANLLLILGMAFCLGGLRYREQLYNSTVTQMSACLLSLSVISLVLPTGFHMSFSDNNLADAQSLKISRGTSVVLLLVYLIYLLFQLKSHAYMYESTPQHIIDEESTPGPVAVWLDSSTSDSSSSSDSDSDGTSRSRETYTKRMRRVMLRSGRRRKSSVASVETNDVPHTRTPSFGTSTIAVGLEDSHNEELFVRPSLISKPSPSDGNDEALEDERPPRHKRHRHRYSMRRHRKHKKKSFTSDAHDGAPDEETIVENPEPEQTTAVEAQSEPRRVDFAVLDAGNPSDSKGPDAGLPRRPFNGIRNISLRPVAMSLTPTVFAQAPKDPSVPEYPVGPVPRIRIGIRRTNSLPALSARPNEERHFRPPGAMMPSQIPLAALASGNGVHTAKEDDLSMSRVTAIVLLLISTALVAVCAEFMVDSINGLVATTSVGETFVGLIILPIVGNAAEHVTAITVALKNKMDLAIGVAVGSSIQIALFITPLVVVLGWIIDREMTLYFTLFETISLAASALMVNFLVLDGRSNYLEGTLLCATYVIISLAAFFYPNADQASSFGA